MLMHRDRLIRLGIAPLSVAIATLLTHLLLPYLAPANLAGFYAAVALNAYLGGLRAGLLASGLSLLAIAYLFVLPLESGAELERSDFSAGGVQLHHDFDQLAAPSAPTGTATRRSAFAGVARQRIALSHLDRSPAAVGLGDIGQRRNAILQSALV
ncbi:MAG: DUF4118 domain-containing protein [Leptolyngbyaceae cyanobacterium SM1_3_5]|nr:DUF4118 domain-containing protein [Leptolyngbyaceae cyanobacterium SM1_3_5]